MAHFAISMQNSVYYFWWKAVLIVVTKSFLTDTKSDKFGKGLDSRIFQTNNNSTFLFLTPAQGGLTQLSCFIILRGIRLSYLLLKPTYHHTMNFSSKKQVNQVEIRLG